jgi:hypothetical protein
MLLGGGVAVYLLGNVMLRRALGISPVRYRVAAAGAAIATTLLGAQLSALVQFVGLVAVLVSMFVVETSSRDSRKVSCGRPVRSGHRPGPTR